MTSPLSRFALLLMLIAGLFACGGGGGGLASGVGSGGTGSAAGPVTGLASIILGTQDYDDAEASFTRTNSSGVALTMAASQLKLGHQVEMTLDAQGKPQRLHIQAQLAGLIDSIDSVHASLSVGGLRVLTIASAQGPGPISSYSGTPNFNGLQLQQPVEIYGSYGEDAQGPYILASRIAVLAQDGARLWTGRIVSVSAHTLQLYGQNTRFSLDAPPRITPLGSSLQAGELVTIHASSASGLPDDVHVYGPPAGSTQMTLSGVVYGLQGGNFSVQGIPVQAAGLSSSLQNGDFVQVQGSVSGASVQAQSISIRTAADLLPQLKGSITHYVGPNSFIVRGVPVDASQAQITGSANGLGDGQFVSIQGSLQGNTLLAQQVQVISRPPALATIDLEGTLQSIDLVHRLITMVAAGQVIPLQLASNLVVENTSLASLITGNYVGVEAQLQSDGSYQVNSIHLSPAPSLQSGSLETHGSIYNYDPLQGSFMVNNITVFINGVPVQGGSLSNGSSVELSFTASLPHQALSISLDQ